MQTLWDKYQTIEWEDYPVCVVYYDEDDIEHETEVGEICLPPNISHADLPQEITIAGFVWHLEGREEPAL